LEFYAGIFILGVLISGPNSSSLKGHDRVLIIKALVGPGLS